MKNIITILIVLTAGNVFAQGKYSGGNGSGYTSHILLNQLLRVELLFFEGKIISTEVYLSWSTANEINLEKFIVEKSVDGLRFSPIGSVFPGESLTLQNYMLVDKDPHIGLNYYRLKSLDIDGPFSYSDIIAIRFEREMGSLSVSPNPFSDKLMIRGLESDFPVRIYNAIGDLVFESNTSLHPFNISHLDAGIYFIYINGKCLKAVKE